MGNRLESLRNEIDKLIDKNQPKESRYFVSHLYGVSQFCVLLAVRRGLNTELAAACGMLHDIYQITAGEREKHAKKGAEQAGRILKKIEAYSDQEIAIITAAISRHSKKHIVHEPYDEVLKDADVLEHCLYNPDFPVSEKEMARFNNLLEEFSCSTRGLISAIQSCY
ncbi:MAG: HD domain-containing protein [Gracilibacteraceae bacterium]|nr:HD domain-containing protein [Gracilibacteraceae bacterium]